MYFFRWLTNLSILEVWTDYVLSTIRTTHAAERRPYSFVNLYKSIVRNYVFTDNHLQTLKPFLGGWDEENALG